MNKVILIGRLTRDPEVSYGSGNLAIARFTLAVDRRFKKEGDEQTADFISCRAFSKTAEFIEKYTHKGTKLVLEGRIQTGSYTNKEGQKVYTTDVIADNVEFGESRSSEASNGGNFGGSNSFAPASEAGDGFMNIPSDIVEELPF